MLRSEHFSSNIAGKNVQDCIEHMLTNSDERAGSASLGSLCFAHHVDNATSGECD